MTWVASSVRTILNRLAYETRGSEIAEAAVVLPLLFVMLIAVFWFGQAFRIYGTITHAAREGARAAVAPPCATCSSTAATPAQNAATAVTNAMAAAHLNTAQLVPLASWTRPALCPCGSANSSCGSGVACDGTASINVCVQTNVQLSYVNPAFTPPLPGDGTCGTSVSMRYKYPYRFTLPCWPQPCTPLDLSNLSLPGQAQMRLETQ
ncbi:MAG: TadE/TadG family type IV pilus assembly protein [Candidatus Sulfotelmatobacter sp.]|jgi:Flp pilus assembly protein TadG